MAMQTCSQEGGWDAGVGRSSSIQPNSRRILIKCPLARKIWGKLSSVNSLQYKNTLNYIQQSHKFDTLPTVLIKWLLDEMAS